MNDDPAVGPILQKHCPRCSAWNEATVDRLPRDGTTKPTVGEIDLYIPAECPFRANRKNVANHQHPNHKHRINELLHSLLSGNGNGCVGESGERAFGVCPRDRGLIRFDVALHAPIPITAAAGR
jgi:hypothetical protein